MDKPPNLHANRVYLNMVTTGVIAIWYNYIAMTSAQNELQASHESELKKLHSEKKAVQRDLSSTKTKIKNLEEAKNKLETEVHICS